MITKNPYEDPEDKYDSEKWAFPEKDLLTFYVDDYPYKINNTGSHYTNLQQVYRLVKIRTVIRELTKRVEYYITNTELDTELKNGLKLFVDVHSNIKRTKNDYIHYAKQFHQRLQNNNNYSEKYLLSELPMNNKVAMKFIGLDVPKMRYISNEVPIGPDRNIRCCYRDIYLSSKLRGSPLKDLIIHELSHTVASHHLYRPDDHKSDFQRAEKVLKMLAFDLTFDL